jgi:hypothetical protein
MGENEMSGTDCLVPFIDNGGQRSLVERRKKTNIYYLWERRSNKDRRRIIDRREIFNQKRYSAAERRVVFQK